MAINPTIPDRLNNDFFAKVLQTTFKFATPVKIESTNIQLATAAGDNYCSEIYRAKVVFSGGSPTKLEQISLIVKDMPPGEHRGAILEDLRVYERETEMYCKTLPTMSRLLNNEFFSAKCLYATREPCKMMVFQDLKALGYQMADRKSGLDYEHCRLIMEKLGRFHGVSLVYGEQHPEAMEAYKFGMLDPNVRKNNDHVENFFNGGLDMLIKVLGGAEWVGYERILEKLQTIRLDFIDRMYKHVETDEDTIRVLNHGDLWVNNTMFQYNDTKPSNVVFVDYQMSFYSSPGIDINYFFCTSPTHEVRVNRRKDLIAEYYRSFASTLSMLNYSKVPTREELEADVLRKEFYGFIACVSVLPMVLMEKQPEQGGGMDAMLDEKTAGSFREICFNGEKYKEAIAYILKRFEELNVLN